MRIKFEPTVQMQQVNLAIRRWDAIFVFPFSKEKFSAALESQLRESLFIVENDDVLKVRSNSNPISDLMAFVGIVEIVKCLTIFKSHSIKKMRTTE